jgi:ankyrin repeat protein
MPSAQDDPSSFGVVLGVNRMSLRNPDESGRPWYTFSFCHLWASPVDVPKMLAFDSVLLALLSYGRHKHLPERDAGDRKNDLLSDGKEKEKAGSGPQTVRSAADVTFAVTCGRLLSLPYWLTRWTPTLSISKTHLLQSATRRDSSTPYIPRHIHCYELAPGSALNRECIHVPMVSLQRAFCPFSNHPEIANLSPQAPALAAAVLGNFPLVQRLLLSENPKVREAIFVGATLSANVRMLHTWESCFKEHLLCNFEGCTPFHAAAQSGSDEVMKLLLGWITETNPENATEAHLKVLNTPNRFSENVLHVALRSNDKSMVQRILDTGMIPDAAAICRALEMAAETRDFDFANPFLDSPEVFQNSRLNQHSPFCVACTLADVHDGWAFRLLELSGMATRNGQNKYGESPLHCLARIGHVKLLEEVLRQGADPNVGLNRTPFVVTCQTLSKYCRGVVLHGIGTSMLTADILSKLENHVRVCELLLEHGASRAVPSSVPRSILHASHPPSEALSGLKTLWKKTQGSSCEDAELLKRLSKLVEHSEGVFRDEAVQAQVAASRELAASLLSEEVGSRSEAREEPRSEGREESHS